MTADPAGRIAGELSCLGRTTIARFNVIVPHWFPFSNPQVPLSPSFPRLSKKQVLELEDALHCVDSERHLYVRTHRANVRTPDSEWVRGGLISLAVDDGKIRASMAALMARRATA